MAKLIINGGNKLEGEVRLAGNKNSVLKLLPATLLADSPSTITNVPNIRDVDVMLMIMEKLGAKVTRNIDTVTIDPTSLSSYEIDAELSAKIRASVVLAPALLAKFGKAIITPPGGDQIGERLLDTHFNMMRDFGVEIERKDGRFFLDWKEKKTPNIFLEEVSVTATEMGIMMAAASQGEVIIEDAACEPHVRDLSNFVAKMGADFQGMGSNTLRITGKKNLNGAEQRVMADYIEGGTFAIASAITGGKVKIMDFEPENYKMILEYLGAMGVKHEAKNDELIILPSNLRASRRKFQTRPWPGFPTDLMSPFIVLATQTEGTVLCHDWMYEWRMFFVDDLISMGANIFIADPHRVIINGKTKLMADILFSKDLRAGISLILAALVAEGKSVVENIEMVERGYQNIDSRLTSLGADVTRVDD
ncbi:MAG TPA: UDP-N-acetylglucosamine 1-carboxyvinyltransferase [Alphaproteobacteria bacterium]|jgi:UDP-N-acetylglucosamine 1-carboxyvinyltransferase|nr:UDP-N-acetylglucosamine 1-carboxyvinyltransferase [Alphaproteobacteria bacterium]